MRATQHVAWLVAAAVLSGGCSSFLYGQTGAVMSGYTTDHVTPYMLATDDLDLACRTGGAFGTFVSSFARVTDSPDLAALISVLSAGMCAENAAWEADLGYARELRAGRASDAKDAKLRGERWHQIAAKRFGAAYQRAIAAFGPLDGKCPEVEPAEEVFLLLGLSSGLMAVLHDRSSGGAAGISMSIPRTAERATRCLSSDKWWGVPNAMAAMVWLTVPGSAPKGKDPKETLSKAVLIGDKAGVRLARAMQVLAVAGSGDEKGLRDAIAAHGKSLETTKANPTWLLLDAYATALSRQQSDLIWMAEKGHRGPTAGLGKLPSKPEAIDPSEDADLLDDLDDDK